MAYDAARRQVVLFGGRDYTNNSLRDTWTWDGSTWTKKAPGSIPDMETGNMAYDVLDQQAVMIPYLSNKTTGFGTAVTGW